MISNKYSLIYQYKILFSWSILDIDIHPKINEDRPPGGLLILIEVCGEVFSGMLS